MMMQMAAVGEDELWLVDRQRQQGALPGVVLSQAERPLWEGWEGPVLHCTNRGIGGNTAVLPAEGAL